MAAKFNHLAPASGPIAAVFGAYDIARRLIANPKAPRDTKRWAAKEALRLEAMLHDMITA